MRKFFELARERERASVGIGEFANELKHGSKREPLAEVEPTEPMVTLCTVHQAKGLEWPVVVLRGPRPSPLDKDSPRIRAERGLPVAARPPKTKSKSEGKSETFEAAQSAAAEAAEAENRRLLYVALTRARDYLVLGHWSPKQKDNGSWASLLNEPVAERLPALIPRVSKQEAQ